MKLGGCYGEPGMSLPEITGVFTSLYRVPFAIPLSQATTPSTDHKTPALMHPPLTVYTDLVCTD